jgi:hypothetical protein
VRARASTLVLFSRTRTHTHTHTHTFLIAGVFKFPVDAFGAGFFNGHVVSALQTQNHIKTVTRRYICENNDLTTIFVYCNHKMIEKMTEEKKSVVKIFLDAFITKDKIKQLAL